jgi:Ser/Thr protein kinase RdoA (MazF antagonist)
MERLPNSEREFERLSRRTQIRQLRQLAVVALAAYDLPPARLTLLAHLFNTTFRVDSQHGERYVLRIHRAGTPTVESVGAELAWLAALRRDTTLQVPAPVPTRAGGLLTVAAAADVPQPHICVLFRWMPGKIVRRGLTPSHLARAGELMARLQMHALEWRLPSGFARGRVDYPIESVRYSLNPFAPEVLERIHSLVACTLSAGEAMLVTEVLERVRATEESLGIGETDLTRGAGWPATFGLIHADLHYWNLLFVRGSVRAIDFDDCGFGPFLFDPAVMLSALLGRAEYRALRGALLAGYRRVRPLSVKEEAHLDTFIALRQVQDALWVLEWRKHPAIGGDWAAQARSSLAQLSSFLEAGGRFPA